MPVAPYYEALSVEETLTYLRAVAGSVDIPVMVYNLPMATGVDLHPDTVGALAREVENIRYIKNTTIDMAQSAALIHNHGDVLSTFVGWDSLLLSALAEGAAGVMAGTANVVPSELVAVYDAVNAGDLEGARKTWAQIYPLIEAIMAQPFIAAVKAGLAAVGFPVGDPRPPVARARPRRGRPDRATGEDDNDGGDDGNCQRQRRRRRCAGYGPPEASCRTASFLPVSTSSTERSGPAGPARPSTSSTPAPSARSPRSPRARPRTPTSRWPPRTPRRTRGAG